MNPEEFSISVKLAEAEEKKGQWSFLVIYIGGMLVIGLPFARVPEDLWWVHLIGIILFFGWLLLPIRFLLKKARIRAEKYGLKCPHCHKAFLVPDRKIVLSGGNCCYCGLTVISK
jgi:uncharacterized membrane protein YecN with MAPEG domain